MFPTLTCEFVAQRKSGNLRRTVCLRETYGLKPKKHDIEEIRIDQLNYRTETWRFF